MTSFLYYCVVQQREQSIDVLINCSVTAVKAMNKQNFTASEEYPDLENHNSNMAHCLTEDIYKRMRGLETSSGFSIDDVIQTGVDNPGDPYNMAVGCLAGDGESYQVFAEFFDLIIEAKHFGYKKMDRHITNINFEEDKSFCVSPAVLSCLVRGSRNIKGFCLPSHCTRAERRKVENIAKKAFLKLTGEYKGKYIQIKNLSEEHCLDIMDSLQIPKSPSASLPLCMSRDWPDARGVFISDQNKFAVKINIEDHFEINSIQSDGNLNDAFSGWCEGVKQLEQHLQDEKNSFMKSEHLGYITTCPGKLGTGLKITVKMNLPKLSKHPRVEEVVCRLRMGKQSSAKTKQNSSTLEIFNQECLGYSEVEIMQSMKESIAFLLMCEEKMGKNESIERDINRMKNK